MKGNANALNWFEIPVSDFDRGRKFYETIFDIEMAPNQMGNNMMGFFPYEMGSGNVSGAICHGEGYTPSTDGSKIYLNGNPDLQTVLDRVEGAGGSIVLPKTQITPEIGFFAIVQDTEGNHVHLHSGN